MDQKPKMIYRRSWLGRHRPAPTLWTPLYWNAAVLASAAPIAVLGVGFINLLVLGAIGIALLIFFGLGGSRYEERMRGFMLGWALWSWGWLLLSTADFMWGPGLIYVTGFYAVAGTLATMRFWVTVRDIQTMWEDRQEQLAHDYAVTTDATVNDVNMWEGMFSRIVRQSRGDTRIRLITVKRRSTGRSARMRLSPYGRVTFDSLRQLVPEVELGLRGMGLSIKVGSVKLEQHKEEDGGLSPTDFWVHVNETVRARRARPLPDEHTPESITEPKLVGYYQDGPEMRMVLPGRNVLVIGQTGDGKSNFLTILMHQISRCPNATIWGIDLKGGATIRALLEAWRQQVVHPFTRKPVRWPVLSWVAVDPFEAWRVMNAFHAIMTNRPFRRRKGNKHVPTEDEPQIFLLIEEASLVVADQMFMARGTAGALTAAEFLRRERPITAISRSEGGTVVKVSQRNTSTMAGSGDANANYLTRVGFSADSLADARMIFPKSANAAALVAANNEPGVALINERYATSREVPVDVCFAGDDEAYDMFTMNTGLLHGNTVGHIRQGTPDYEIAAQYGYADRWSDPERSGWLNYSGGGVWIGKPPTPKQLELLGVGAPSVPSPRAGGSASGKLEKMKAAAAAKMAAPLPKDDAWVAETIQEAERFANGTYTGDPGSGDNDDPATLDRIVAIVESFPGGCSAGQLTQALIDEGLLKKSNRKQLYRWLTKLKEKNRLIQPNGSGTFYFTPPR